MKNVLLALSSSLLIAGCAGVHVSDTQIASGAVNPRSIYIRPFDTAATVYVGDHRGGPGERPIRQSLAGHEFADNLREELEKLAPAMVIKHNEYPTEGWLVEGSIDVHDNGSACGRAVPIASTLGLGRSHVKIHVVIRDVNGHYAHSDKETGALGARAGNIIYEFDLEGGSHGTGRHGSIYAPGLGDAEPFDYKNAAERVMMALSTDPHRYGVRTSPTIR